MMKHLQPNLFQKKNQIVDFNATKLSKNESYNDMGSFYEQNSDLRKDSFQFLRRSTDMPKKLSIIYSE